MSSGLVLAACSIGVFLVNNCTPISCKKILSVFDDCLIREISKDRESSHPADEYNDYWLSSGLPEAFFGCGLIYLYFLSTQPRALIWSCILQVLSPSLSCRRPSATTNLTWEGKGSISWMIKAGKRYLRLGIVAMLRVKLSNSCFYYLSCDRLCFLLDFAREEGLYNHSVGVNSYEGDCKARRQVWRIPNGFVVIF